MESLRTKGSFPSEAEDGGAGEGVEKEPEEALAWTLFLRAQLEERTGFLQEAYETLRVSIVEAGWLCTEFPLVDKYSFFYINVLTRMSQAWILK